MFLYSLFRKQNIRGNEIGTSQHNDSEVDRAVRSGILDIETSEKGHEMDSEERAMDPCSFGATCRKERPIINHRFQVRAANI